MNHSKFSGGALPSMRYAVSRLDEVMREREERIGQVPWKGLCAWRTKMSLKAAVKQKSRRSQKED